MFSPAFNITFILLMLPSVVALLAENAGHVKAVSEMTGDDLDPEGHPSRERVQVSMNLVDLERTGLQDACAAVRAGAGRVGARVESVEVVGLLPASELARCDAAFLDWAFSSGQREAGALGYVALPEELAARERSAVSRFKAR